MIDLTNNPKEKGEDSLAKVHVGGLLDSPTSTPSKWWSRLLFWRKPGLPAPRRNLSLSTKTAGLPAVLLGALLFLALIRTDLAYWDRVVKIGSRIVSVPTRGVEFAYQKITFPLNFVLDGAKTTLVKVEKTDYFASVENLDFRGEDYRDKGQFVLSKLLAGENNIVKKIQRGSQVASLALVDKSNQLSSKAFSLSGKIQEGIKKTDFFPSSLGDKVSIRQEILTSRSSKLKEKIAKFEFGLKRTTSFDLSLNIKKGRSQLASVGDQAAAVWNSKILLGVEKTIYSYREFWNNFGQRLSNWLITLDERLVWLENLPTKFHQKISSLWTASLLKADEIATNWNEFLNPKKEISQKDLEEIKKAVAEEISKNLQGQVQQAAVTNKTASYGAVVVPSTGNATSDAQIKKDLENQFSDDVSVKFDKSGQAGVITPIFENNERGDDYIFLLTPINK